MTLKERLREDLKNAMRERDADRKAALRMVLASVQLAEVESPEPLSDEDIVVLIRKEVKRREEALEMIREAGREDMVAEELAQLKILREYLPAMMTEEEIRGLAQSVIDDLGASSMRDMGRVMGAIMPQVKGRADGRTVSQVVRELLSS
ncbi:MAG: GatB/YqeY domain-containing protein [Anaerolineae bacterium]